jgi:hypothetical protein
MTFPEFFGLCGAAVFSIVGVVVPLLLGYGLVGVIVGLPVGFLSGWVIGVALHYPASWAIDRRMTQERNRASDQDASN